MQIRASVKTWNRHKVHNEYLNANVPLSFGSLNSDYVRLRITDGNQCIEAIVKVSDLAEVARIFSGAD